MMSDQEYYARHGETRQQYRSDVAKGVGKLLLVILIVLVLVGVGLWAWEQWYVGTHCTMVLGTQVCR